MAKVVIPKSMPILLLFIGADSLSISTTKLRKYLLALSFMIVIDDGTDGNCLDHTGFTLPILARYTLPFLIVKALRVNLADCCQATLEAPPSYPLSLDFFQKSGNREQAIGNSDNN